jgi:hypothetical protein
MTHVELGPMPGQTVCILLDALYMHTLIFVFKKTLAWCVLCICGRPAVQKAERFVLYTLFCTNSGVLSYPE